MKRTVLFLQGPPSPFWRELAERFEAEGHATRKVNFCPADQLYWRRPGADAYRGKFDRWRMWLRDYLARHEVTDILYYADRLPYHVVASELADEMGICACAVEFGYLRPDWITLERSGMGAYSRFTRDPETIRRIAAAAPAPDLSQAYGHSFGQEATNEVAFNLANVFLRPMYPRFHADRHYHPLVDYLSWLPKFAVSPAVKRQATRVSAEVMSGKWPFHLVALQLQSDYQVRDNSPYACISEMIEEVVASFARNAPEKGRLVFKRHPLDNGLERWPAKIRAAARRHGVAERVLFIDGGRLDLMISRAEGVIAINSTVGLHAIRASKPVKILGSAVFALPGLTHQGPLDGFWRKPEAFDAALARDFITAIAAAIQVKGSFYHPEGRKAAAAEIVRRVAAGLVNAPREAIPEAAEAAEAATRAA